MALPEPDPEPGVPEWVVTYGDMMSLLLTFFIMLVSMSEMKDDSGTLRAMMDAIHEQFGPTAGSVGVPGTSTQTNSAFSEPSSRGMRAEGGTKKASRNSAGSGGAHAAAKRINHGTVITLGGPTQFAAFDSSLTKEMKEQLSIIFDAVADAPQRIVVRGHASPESLPDNAPFIADMQRNLGQPAPGMRYDRFDLSFARANAVAQYLIERGIDPNRLIISSAGDAEPRLTTPDVEKQAVNRRVDVFLIDSYITRPNSSAVGQR